MERKWLFIIIIVKLLKSRLIVLFLLPDKIKGLDIKGFFSMYRPILFCVQKNLVAYLLSMYVLTLMITCCEYLFINIQPHKAATPVRIVRVLLCTSTYHVALFPLGRQA